MTADPATVEGQLAALRRYFHLRYHDEIQQRFLVFRHIFPLFSNSRLDVVRVNGGHRVHFLYQRGAGEEHLVVVHDLTVGGGPMGEDEELRFVRLALNVAEPLAHFVLHPPFGDQFDLVEREAVAAVARHARMRPRALDPGEN